MTAIKIPSGKVAPLFTMVIDSGKGGTVTNVDEAKQNPNQSPETTNFTLVQDGIWQTRPGSTYYGTTPNSETSVVAGWEYVVSETSRHIICIGVSGTAYKSTNNGTTWSTLSGATFTPGNQYFFLQIDLRLYITNNSDALTYYDGSSLVRNTAILKPANFTATRGAGLTAGAFSLFYTVTALNAVGETEGATEATVTTNLRRDVWSGATELVNLAWDAVTGAVRYQIYLEDESGAQVYLDETTTNSYADDGSRELNPYVETPLTNTTGGPILGRLALSNNRIWGIDENNNVVFSGTGQYINNFSFFYGGGYTELDKGGREFPTVVTHYRTGKGDTAPTVFSKSADGRGSIWQIAMDSITIGSETITIPTPVKIVGSIGAQGESAITDANDNVFSANKKGVYALRNKAQMFNVLSTEEQTVNIRPTYRSAINGAKYDDIVAYFSDAKVLFSASQNGSSNDTTFLYDTERNAWIWAWTLGFEQLFEYTDSNESTHLLGIVSGESKLIEVTDRATTDYDGGAIETIWKSPLLHIDPKNKATFAKIKDVILELGRPQGNITFQVLGLQKNKPLSLLATKTYSDTVSNVDFHNYLFGDGSFGDDDETPSTFAQASVKKRVRVNKLLNAIQYRITSTTANTKYTINSVMARGRVVPTRPPSEWDN